MFQAIYNIHLVVVDKNVALKHFSQYLIKLCRLQGYLTCQTLSYVIPAHFRGVMILLGRLWSIIFADIRTDIMVPLSAFTFMLLQLNPTTFYTGRRSGETFRRRLPFRKTSETGVQMFSNSTRPKYSGSWSPKKHRRGASQLPKIQRLFSGHRERLLCPVQSQRLGQQKREPYMYSSSLRWELNLLSCGLSM